MGKRALCALLGLLIIFTFCSVSANAAEYISDYPLGKGELTASIASAEYNVMNSDSAADFNKNTNAKDHKRYIRCDKEKKDINCKCVNHAKDAKKCTKHKAKDKRDCICGIKDKKLNMKCIVILIVSVLMLIISVIMLINKKICLCVIEKCKCKKIKHKEKEDKIENTSIKK